MIDQINKVAMISALAERVPQLGRTSLMKLCYFLQTLRRVPLGYHFTLYSYGPFDSDVLSDLDTATAMQGVVTSVVSYYNGYGYKIEPGLKSSDLQRRSGGFTDKYSEDITWVVQEFGSMSASELELASTIIYSDREAAVRKEKISKPQLCTRVRDVKPHFTIEQIREMLDRLAGNNLLIATN